MLTLDSQQTSALDYSNLNTSIQDTFAAIDRFEWQASDELRLMRDNRHYKDGGHVSFEEYCESELTQHGGYRRVRDLLAAKKVVDTLPEELRAHITKPSQTRSLLRLVKTPDKLHEAVAHAVQEKTFPTAADFAKAVNKVVPTSMSNTRTNTTTQEKTKTQLCQSVTEERLGKEGRLSNNTITHGAEQINPKSLPSFLFAKCVRVSSQSHSRYGESGVIEADAPNDSQQIVTFSDGEKLLINNADLNDAIVSFSTERTYPKEYAEALAELKEQHKQELERLSQELRIGLQTEANARAEEQAKEQVESLQKLYRQQKEQSIQLQQRLDEMEGLRQLELENQRLLSRIQELEHAVEQRPAQQWGNTLNKQATKVLNKGVQQALEKTIDLRSLAQEPPKENAQECLRLMGMALKQIASAINNAQALEAAAIILGSKPTPEAIAWKAEQLQLLPQAVNEIRGVLAKDGCTWEDYWAVATKYQAIEKDYRAELTTEETELITILQNTSTQPPTIQFGSIVAHADCYRALYLERGEVIEDLGEEVLVAWDHWKGRSKKTDRYFKNELRFWQP